MQDSTTATLLTQVKSRLKPNVVLNRFRTWVIALSAIYLILLLIVRLLSLIPDFFTPLMTISPVLIAFLFAWLIPVKMNQTDSAREIDRHTKSDDLFLTAATLKSAQGNFQELVRQKAETKAKSVNSAEVTPYSWQSPSKAAALAIAVLIACFYTLPQLDPFGKEQQRVEQNKKKKSIDEARKETEKRLAAVKKQNELPKDSEQTKAELTKILQQMKKNKPQDNVKKLQEKKTSDCQTVEREKSRFKK